ncbi:MAG: hypothetical protein ACREJQ_03715, partial [bacterium]
MAGRVVRAWILCGLCLAGVGTPEYAFAGTAEGDSGAPAGYALTGRWGAAKAVDVKMAGNLALVAAGGLDIYDLSDPAHPARISSIGTRGSAYRIATYEHTAFVATHRGLTVVNFEDPANPKVLGVYTNPAEPLAELFGLTVSKMGDLSPPYLLLTDLHSLQILDASDPAHPRPVGLYRFQSLLPDRVRAEGKYAFVSGMPIESGDKSVETTSLVVVNLANPSAPKVVGRYATDGDPVGLDVAGSRAFLLVKSRDPDAPPRLETLDVADLTRPKLIHAFEVGRAPVTLSVVTQEIPRTDGRTDPAIYVYILDQNSGLMFVDATDAMRPQLLGGFGLPPVAFAMVFSENTAVVANGENGIRVFDASNLPNLDEVYADDWPMHASEPRLTFDGNLKLSMNGGLAVFTAGNEEPAVEGVLIYGDDFGGGVYQFRWAAPCFSQSVAAFSNYFAIACTKEGLGIFDTTIHPGTPFPGIQTLEPVGQWVKDSPAMRVYAHDDELIVEDGDGILHVLDVTDPADPVEKPEAVPLEYAFTDKVATLDYIWVAEGAKGVKVYPRSPSRAKTPEPVTLIPSLDTAWGLAISEKTLAVADGWAGVLVVDVTDSTAPKEIARLDVPGECRAVAFAPNPNMLIVLSSAGVFNYSLPTSAPAPPLL